MKLRTAFAWLLTLGGLFAGAGRAVAGAEEANVLNTLYGSGNWAQVTNDKLWSAVPPGSVPLVNVDVKLAANNTYELGIISATGTSYSTFGAFTGTKNLDGSGVNQTFLALGNQYIQTGPTLAVLPAATLDPFAWDVRTYDFTTQTDPLAPVIYNAPSGTWSSFLASSSSSNINGTNQFDSQRNDDAMHAYRIGTGSSAHYVLFWDTNNDGDYSDLVLEVTGVKNPEPTSLALMGLGAAGLLGYRLRRKTTKATV